MHIEEAGVGEIGVGETGAGTMVGQVMVVSNPAEAVFFNGNPATITVNTK